MTPTWAGRPTEGPLTLLSLARLAGVRLGVIADIHGNELALRSVLEDPASRRVDLWWVLGDLVLFGPRPAEVLELLAGLPGVAMLRGNTDRYVLTGEQRSSAATPTTRPTAWRAASAPSTRAAPGNRARPAGPAGSS